MGVTRPPTAPLAPLDYVLPSPHSSFKIRCYLIIIIKDTLCPCVKSSDSSLNRGGCRGASRDPGCGWGRRAREGEVNKGSEVSRGRGPQYRFALPVPQLGIPGYQSSKGAQNPAALARGEAGGQRGASFKLLSPFIIQRQSPAAAGPFSPGPDCTGAHNTVSCPNVLFILLNRETGSQINTGGRCVLPGSGQDLRPTQAPGSSRLPRRCLT